MLKLDIDLDHSLLHFNVKKKKLSEELHALKEHFWFDWQCWILDTDSLNSQFNATLMPDFIFRLAFLSEKDKIL